MVERSPFEIAATLLEVAENVNRTRLIRRFLALNLCLNNRTAFAKVPMSDRRSNTICAVVERPDHHCGHNLVDLLLCSWMKLCFAVNENGNIPVRRSNSLKFQLSADLRQFSISQADSHTRVGLISENRFGNALQWYQI